MKLRFLFTLLLFLTLPVILFSQTALRIERLLDTLAVSYEDAAQFVLEAANINPGTIDGAFVYAMERKWLPKKALAGDEASLSGVALLIMRSFNINGGIMFTIFKNPHYAYRELTYQNIIIGRKSPGMAVSGDDLLFMISRILARFPPPDLQYMEAAPFVQEELPAELLLPELLDDAVIAEILGELRTELDAHDLAEVTVELTDEEIMLSLSDIQFLADSVELPESEVEKLMGIAQALSYARVHRLLIAGHTAMAGSAQGRQEISLARAEAVKDFLVSLGVLSEHQIIAHGYGGDRPIADNSTPQGMALNRRVEFIILEHY